MSSTKDAAHFWDLYFRNLFVRLERSANGYRGLAYADPISARAPVGFFRPRQTKAIEISMDELRRYDYDGDGRFSLILRRPATLIAALDAVIAMTYPYRDPAPYGKERMAELCSLLRARIMPSRDGGLESAHQILSRMIAEHTPALDQPIAALVWVLGEQRQKLSAPYVLEVVKNSSYWPFARHQLHFTAVDTAFSALWKIDEKGITWEVLDLMRHSSESGKRKMAALMERLFSTTELLSLDRLDEKYLDPEFWANYLAPFRNAGPLDFDRNDAHSLFWEIRFLSAIRLPIRESELLKRLYGDEVGTVRQVVARRLEQRM
ncbi:MAG TPA: hypothetical protein VE621_08175 [Bryobacteraceae bacterium]|nr:hypothetical protein [Bryobacteraceae bacterium]